jgi:hypothetical protein
MNFNIDDDIRRTGNAARNGCGAVVAGVLLVIALVAAVILAANQ